VNVLLLPAGFNWKLGRPPLTRKGGVYVFAFQEQILYIGQSKRLRQRYDAHTQSPWYRLTAGMLFGVHGEKIDFYWSFSGKLEMIESKLIHSLSPLLNEKHKH
jgi:predicted GIY-YIG superfamily endonuclease